MRLFVNGSSLELAGTPTLSILIDSLRLGAKRFAVELNGEIVPRSQHSQVALNEGDRIEVVQAVGGG
ncbi:MAG: sulfur carrier protein ThiS [Panacagrimonas sp.]